MDFDKSSIERLKRTLYSRNENVVPKEKRTPVQATEVVDVPSDFGTKPSFDIPFEKMTEQKNSFFNKFLLGSMVFFFITLSIASFIFFGGFRTISSNNVDIRITAPSSISSGEEFDIGLSVVNQNSTDLMEVALFIEYPEGAETVNTSDPLEVRAGRTLSHSRIDLGIINKGQSKDYALRAVLSGAKDIIKIFTFRLEYKVSNSNAVFSKEKTYEVLIGSSPLILDVQYPTEVNSGQPVTLFVNLTSNSSVVTKNSLIKVDYPFGFTYKDSNIKPLPSTGNSIWNMGDLKSGDKKILNITGVLIGQDLEDRSFIVSVGTRSDSIATDFSAKLAEFIATVGIRKSFFDLTLSSDQNESLQLGQSVSVYAKWQNTLPVKIINNHIEVTMDGNILDQSSVLVGDGGFYRSLDNTIIWNKNTTNDLISLSPGDKGQVSFSLSSFINSAQIRTVKNPHINISVVITGNRSGEDTAEISSSADITLKFPSTLSLSAKSYRDVGPFTNTGPVPPRANKETTYTVTWVLTNTANDLKDTIVSAELPVGVEWKNQTSPISENIIYNPDNRIILWKVSNVSAGTGFTNSAKTVSFKVAIIPSLNQIGSVLPILSPTDIMATDTYTSTTLKSNEPALTTHYFDQNFRDGNDIVVN